MSNVTKLFEMEPSVLPMVFQGQAEKASATSWVPSPPQPTRYQEEEASSQAETSSDEASRALREETLEMLDTIPMTEGNAADSMGHQNPAMEDPIEAARHQGYLAGRQEALEEMQQADATHSAKTAETIHRLQLTTGQLDQTYRWEAVDLACRIAKAILGADLGVDSPLIHRSVEHLMSTIPRCQELAIRCHPDDIAAMEQHVPDLQRVHGQLIAVHLIPDQAIERGGLVVDFGEGSLDTQPSVSVDVLREAIERDVLEAQHTASSQSTSPTDDEAPSTSLRSGDAPVENADADSMTDEMPTEERPETALSVEDEPNIDDGIVSEETTSADEDIVMGPNDESEVE